MSQVTSQYLDWLILMLHTGYIAASSLACCYSASSLARSCRKVEQLHRQWTAKWERTKTENDPILIILDHCGSKHSIRFLTKWRRYESARQACSMAPLKFTTNFSNEESSWQQRNLESECRGGSRAVVGWGDSLNWRWRYNSNVWNSFNWKWEASFIFFKFI